LKRLLLLQVLMVYPHAWINIQLHLQRVLQLLL
jgi:hypothetical protein